MPTAARLALLLALAPAGPVLAQLPATPASPAARVLLAPAGAERVIAEVRAADDARLAATIAADRAALEEIFAEVLHYAHSNGHLDSKASLIADLTSGRIAYRGVRHLRRDFLLATDDVVLVTGRAVFAVESNGQALSLDLNYLAVWRRDAGRWRFLAWQSSRPPPAS